MKWIDGVVWLTLGLVIGLIITTYHHDKKIQNLEYRIEILEMETYTTKLFLKQTQRLLVPDEIALLREIPARQ